MEIYATKEELAKEVERLDKKDEYQAIEIKENREHLAVNDIQTGNLEVIMNRIDKSVDKLTDSIDKFSNLVVGALIFPIVVAAVVFFLFKG